MTSFLLSNLHDNKFAILKERIKKKTIELDLTNNN